MKIAAVLFIIVALISAGAYATTVSPQIGGGIGQFDGGISSTGAAPVSLPCSPGSTDGSTDLSLCSNAIYPASGLL